MLFRSKKSGSLNCHDGSGSSVGSSGQCSWSALAIGGSTLNPPKAACTEANAWSKAIDGNGIEQSCICSNIPHPADPPVVRGYMAAAVYGHRNMEYYEFLTGNGSQQPSAINSTECIVGTTYRGYTSCPGDWLGESPNNYKSCEAWTQECTVNPN